MVKISDLIVSLDRVVAAQDKLADCRKHAAGNVDYFSFSFVQDVKEAEAVLEQTLNAYIDQRLAQKLEQLKMPAGFELPVRPVAQVA